MKQHNFLLSLFSMVLVSSCITVPRIDKKDSRNNQFSQQLQNFMAVKHPQRIDTTFKQSKSDTTWGPLILDTNINFANWRFLIGDSRSGTLTQFQLDSIIKKLHFPTFYGETIDPLYFPSQGEGFRYPQTVIVDSFYYPPGQSDMGIGGGVDPCKPKIYRQYIYIHDTVTNAVINHSEVDALSSYLKASRDSTSTFQLKYSQSKSAGLIKLFIAIGLGLLLILSIILYFQKK